MSRLILFSIALTVSCGVFPGASVAQSPCPRLTGTYTVQSGDPLDHRVMCTVPELYGPQGIFVGDDIVGGSVINTFGGGGQFQFSSNLASTVNTNVATQVALLPLVAPASGINLVFDKALGVYLSANESFGPIFSERAQTIGRHRLAIGFSYQYSNFDTLDGINLRNFPTVFIQPTNPFSGQPCDVVQLNNSCPGLQHDYISAMNRIDLKINEYTSFATFGITKNVDISIAVPVLAVTMDAAANSVFVYNSNQPGALAFGANATPGFLASNGECLASVTSASLSYCAQALFFNSQRSSGVGDLTIRGKVALKQWEHAGFAAGIDVRVPSGDEKGFLGTGAVGIRPFAVWSYRGRFSPHVNIGYQWNGQSVLAGDVATGTKASLPGEFLYSGGLGGAITKRLTATVDLVGQVVINGPYLQLVATPVPGLCNQGAGFGSCTNPQPAGSAQSIAGTTSTYAIDNAVVALRFSPFAKFLLSGSVQLKLDNGGLRSEAIPLVSATYTFR